VPTATALATPTSTPRPSTTPVRERFGTLGTALREVNYCQGDRLTLKLDLYFPSSPKRTPPPLLVYIHGNGADKREVYYLNQVLEAGYALASIEYRDAPGYKLPAPIEDAKCAVRYLRAHAAEYHIDPSRIGAYGCSYGGYLAGMLAVTRSSDGLEGSGGYPDASSQVQAAATLSGFSDWSELVGSNDIGGALVAQYYFGRIAPDDPIVSRASVVTYLSADTPPLLILHGDADESVPLTQAQALDDRAIEAQANATLLVIPGGDHCLANRSETSELEATIDTMLEFFDVNLN
jgi:acetyl esterase/lipase